jgi:hypothetical protein
MQIALSIGTSSSTGEWLHPKFVNLRTWVCVTNEPRQLVQAQPISKLYLRNFDEKEIEAETIEQGGFAIRRSN